MNLTISWYCRYDVLRGEVKFVFSRVGPLQFVRAMIRDKGQWKPIFFSGEDPVLIYEETVIKSKDDPRFHALQHAAMEVMEVRVTEYQKFRGIVGAVDQKAQFRDLEELAHAFVPWQLDRIVRTGDVERGAEQTLMTRQGAEVMAGHRVSPRLRRNLREATKYRRDLVGRKYLKQLQQGGS